MIRIFGTVVFIALLGVLSGIVIAHVEDDDRRDK